MAACARAAGWPRTLSLLADVASCRLTGDVVTSTAAVGACEKAGEWEKALGVLHAGMAARVQGDVVVYNAVVSAHAKGAAWQQSLLMLELLRDQALQKDVISYNSSISACAPALQWQTGLGSLKSLRASALQPDAISCNACTSCCAGVWTRAAALLSAGACSVVGYNALVSAYERGSSWTKALRVWSDLRDREDADSITFNSAVCACDHPGRWQLAVQVYGLLHEARKPPDAVACSAVISACEKGRQWERALALLFAPKMRPNVPAFNAAISACAEASRWPKALALFGSMEAELLQPDVISFNTAIFACQMAGQWSLALSLLAECGAKEDGVECDLISFNSAILACEKPGNQWRHVLKLLSAMEKRQLQGNAVTYDAAVRVSQLQPTGGMDSGIHDRRWSGKRMTKCKHQPQISRSQEGHGVCVTRALGASEPSAASDVDDFIDAQVCHCPDSLLGEDPESASEQPTFLCQQCAEQRGWVVEVPAAATEDCSELEDEQESICCEAADPKTDEVDPRVEAPKCDWQIPDNKFWGIHNRVFALRSSACMSKQESICCEAAEPKTDEVDPRVEAPKCDWQIPDNKFWGIHNRVFVL
ncbi:MRL1 [Symbiodinium sp. CCMP2592]|nr:MRL1 [Symbiodinium sp. CCMP2592]